MSFWNLDYFLAPPTDEILREFLSVLSFYSSSSLSHKSQVYHVITKVSEDALEWLLSAVERNPRALTESASLYPLLKNLCVSIEELKVQLLWLAVDQTAQDLAVWDSLLTTTEALSVTLILNTIPVDGIVTAYEGQKNTKCEAGELPPEAGRHRQKNFQNGGEWVDTAKSLAQENNRFLAAFLKENQDAIAQLRNCSIA
ncbi:hypothetical protein DSO57_1004654 [Entomophthora muscae]|uniref:Uncharacterized protein n=1 Tax=Entomophthora muscae TaxID=34485 RepID=A0ACC2T8E4_9FUNG|nr:hypothetical protein DSO57_1004654 [Entomophthora muscae]